MNSRRSVSLVLAVAAAVMLVTGSFGFTSVTAERNVSVSVVESEDAYVSVSVCSKANSNSHWNGSDPVEVTVKNQFSESFTVESIEWSEDAHSNKTELRPKDSKAKIEPGSTETFNVFGEDEVTVTVSGGVDARVTEAVGQQCAGESKTEDDTETQTSSNENMSTSNGNSSNRNATTGDD